MKEFPLNEEHLWQMLEQACMKHDLESIAHWVSQILIHRKENFADIRVLKF